MLYIFINNKKQTLGVIIDNIPIFRNNILVLGLIQWVRIGAPARTTRITNVKRANHGKKCEDRCSHFRKNAWNRLRFFLNDRYVLHLISPEKSFSSQGTDWSGNWAWPGTPPFFENMNDANICAFKIHKIAFNTKIVDVLRRSKDSSYHFNHR